MKTGDTMKVGMKTTEATTTKATKTNIGTEIARSMFTKAMKANIWTAECPRRLCVN